MRQQNFPPVSKTQSWGILPLIPELSWISGGLEPPRDGQRGERGGSAWARHCRAQQLPLSWALQIPPAAAPKAADSHKEEPFIPPWEQHEAPELPLGCSAPELEMLSCLWDVQLHNWRCLPEQSPWISPALKGSGCSTPERKRGENVKTPPPPQLNS